MPGVPCPPDRSGSLSPRLARALSDARKMSLPSSRVAAALAVAARSGSSASGGDALDAVPSIVYEGELPGGVGVLVRIGLGEDGGGGAGTAQEIRGLFQHAGGKSGKALWMFRDVWTMKCCMRDKNSKEVDEAIEVGIEAGADDFEMADDAESLLFVVDGTRQDAAALKSKLSSATVLGSDISVAREWEVNAAPVSVVPEVWESLEALLRRLALRSDVIDVAHNATSQLLEPDVCRED